MLVMLLPKANKTETKTTTIMVIMVVVEEVDQIPTVVVAAAAATEAVATFKDTIPTTIQIVETLVHHLVEETTVVEVMATMEMAIICQTTRCHTTMLGEITITIETISICPICKHLA